MGFKRKFKRDNFKKLVGGKTPEARLEFKEFKAELPEKETVQKGSELYEYKAYRSLQNVGNIEVKADPNSAVTRGSYPYHILDRMNKVVDANYVGYDNIEGNSITKLQNSGKSDLLNLFDIVTINKRLNYLYLCYDSNTNTSSTGHNNHAANVEMWKAYNEAVSKGYSTMLTDLAFYKDWYKTDMPVPASITSDVQKQAYFKMGALLHYQTVLQNAVAPLSKYIQTRSLEQDALNMSYRREAQIVTQLFGLLKKAAFIATLNAIGTSIIGEYFDANWYKQMNALMFMSSRKANDMYNPLMTSTCTTHVPSLKCYYSKADMEDTQTDKSYYNSDEVLKVHGNFVDPDTFAFDPTATAQDLTFEQAIYRLLRFLDISTILGWARKLNTDPSSVGNISSASAYFENCINKLVNALNVTLARWVTNMEDIRTFIDKLDESNMVYWKKGAVIDLGSIKTFSPDYNVILADLIANDIGGSSTVTFDNDTQRWQCNTMWHKYNGVAEFDKRSGGSFLTFGLRNLSTTIDAEDISKCIPIMFSSELLQGSNKCLAYTRTGLTVTVTHTTATLTENPVLARLDPLNIGFQVKIPRIDMVGTFFPQDTSDAKIASAASSALLLLNTIVGYGEVRTQKRGQGQQIKSYQISDPDNLCFIDIQIDDVSNEMIQFCRNYSPFRVQTPSGARSVGFGPKK